MSRARILKWVLTDGHTACSVYVRQTRTGAIPKAGGAANADGCGFRPKLVGVLLRASVRQGRCTFVMRHDTDLLSDPTRSCMRRLGHSAPKTPRSVGKRPSRASEALCNHKTRLFTAKSWSNLGTAAAFGFRADHRHAFSTGWPHLGPIIPLDRYILRNQAHYPSHRFSEWGWGFSDGAIGHVAPACIATHSAHPPHWPGR